MGKVQQLRSGASLADASAASADQSMRLVAFLYPACSAAVATCVGAVASLAATTAYRVAVWCAVTGAVSLAAGLLRRSARVSSWLAVSSRWLAGASPSEARQRS